jgi:glycosyltransferase involved in cell wall biosynthesis
MENVDDLALKIKEILDLPPDAAAAMRKNCRAHAVAEYAPEIQTERYLRLYHQQLGKDDL